MSNDPIIIETNPSPDAVIIWLHGLGADANDFVSLIPELHLDDLKVRFIFPNAPIRPVTLNNGMQMRSWFDITSLDFEAREEDKGGVEAACADLASIYQEQIKQGIKPERIILAGFSQGGAVVLAAGVRAECKLGGILALSTYLPIADMTPRATPNSPAICMMHGTQDEVVKLQYGLQSKEHLESLGHAVQWRTYDMAHSVSSRQINDIRVWLKARLLVPV